MPLEHLQVDQAHLSKTAAPAYALTLKPLRRAPDLVELVLHGLKWSLGVMFEHPLAVPDVMIVVRELVDNMLIHADWGQSPAPSLLVRYREHRGLPQLCVSSTNVIRDLEEAERALHFLDEHLSDRPSPMLDGALTERLIDGASIRTSGGIGLLQIASSRRCHLTVRLEGVLFHVRVDVDVPTLKASPNV